MFWFNFILGLNFTFFCFKLIVIHYHTQKQKKIAFKPRIKLNHNIHKRKHVMKLVHVLKCLKGLWHGYLVTRLYSRWTWYQVKEWQNHSFFQTKYVSQALYQTLQTTKMNFESLLGEQVFKNHNCNPFQSSLSLTIRAYFCITLACHFHCLSLLDVAY